MIKIAILDDNTNDMQYVKSLIDIYCREKKELFQVQLYENAMDLLFDLDQGKYFDLFFLDVEMPMYSGLEVAREIRKYYLDSIIVYITNYVEYAIEAYEVNAFRYIPKSLLEIKVPEALDAMITKMQNEKQRVYVITHYLDMEIIDHKDIFYFQKEGKYILIFHKKGESRVRKTLQEFLKELDSDDFLEVRKGCAVNIRNVMSIEQQEMILRNGTRILVSRRYLNKIKEEIMNYWAGKM